MFKEEWRSFKEGAWQEEINVRDFIQKNYTPYEGNEDFWLEVQKEQGHY